MPVSRRFTEGPDSYVVTVADTYSLVFLGGDDSLTTRAGTITAYMGAGNDVVRIEGGAATVSGEAGADRFEIYGVNPRLDGGADNDVFNIRGGSGHVLTGATGDDRFNFLAGATNERLYGGDGNDYFSGNSMTVSGILFGQAGNDTFLDFGNFGGAAVSLYGGFGNDWYRADPTSPATFVEYAGQGIDRVEVARGDSYTLPANIEDLVVREFATVAGNATLTGNGIDNRMYGSRGDDTIRGLAGNDSLYGYGGMDVLDGGAGNDRLIGGLWNDAIVSGAGEDVIVYSSVADAPSGVAWDYEFIADWDPVDMIDLSAIDANSTIAGNQPFRFAGYSFGTPVTDQSAGSLTIAGFGGELYIIGHVDGDGVADLVISLWSVGGEAALTVDNLIL